MDGMIQLIGITKTRLNLRSGPGIEYAVLRVLPKGTRLVVLEDLGEWLNVMAEQDFGFVHENYVMTEEHDVEPDAGAAAVEKVHNSFPLKAVTTARVNLRSGPGMEYPIVTTLSQGSEIDVYEDLGEWLNVMHQGKLVYMRGRFIDFYENASDEPILNQGEELFGNDVEMIAGVLVQTDLKAGPGEHYATLSSLQSGIELRVLEDHEAWLTVVFNDLVGCVRTTDVSRSARIIGLTTSVVNLREGPGTLYPVLTIIPENARLEVLEDMGDWLDVQYRGVNGFVREAYVKFTELDDLEVGPAGLQKAQDSDAVQADEPVMSEGLQEPQVLPEQWLEGLVENARAQYGDLYEGLGKRYGIETAVVGAVVAVECGPRGIHSNGRVVLRFENHVFWQYWGRNNQDLFDRYFRFDPGARWQGHAFRTDPGGDWQELHAGSQEIEWQAYFLAADFNLTGARLSASLGAPQIMGFNYSLLEYDSVHAMFAAFHESEEAQLRGFFDLVHGGIYPSDGIAALRGKDFRAFARYYHGDRLTDKYAGMIEQAFRIFKEKTK